MTVFEILWFSVPTVTYCIGAIAIHNLLAKQHEDNKRTLQQWREEHRRGLHQWCEEHREDLHQWREEHRKDLQRRDAEVNAALQTIASLTVKVQYLDKHKEA